MGHGWLLERHTGDAGALHSLVPPDDGRRRIWVLAATAPAVVLGSTQPRTLVDEAAAARAGVAVVRRRSGGGAVWVAPGDPLWVDVLIPRADPLWDDDVGRAFLPVGRAWSAALAAVGVAGTTVHDGPMVHTPWSAAVCFAGRGPGEVLLGDAKVVGISQRRTRAGARFQCAVPRRWDPEPLRSLLRPEPPAGVLDACGASLGDLPGQQLVDALATALG
jgi:lipoate-protein ligase A